MGEYRLPPDTLDEIKRIRERTSALVNTATIPFYTTTGAGARPAASTVKGLIIFNTTTGKHEGSDGVLWNPLY